MAQFRCIKDNQYDGVQLYKTGRAYQFASNPDTDLFEAIAQTDVDAIVTDLTPLPARRDLEGDWHVDVDLELNGNTKFVGNVEFDNMTGTAGIQDYVAWNSGNGLVDWTSPYAAGASTTTVDYQGGSVRFVDGDSGSPTLTYVTFAGVTGALDEYVATSFFTIWTCDRNGDIVQFDTDLTPEQKRDYVQIFVTTHASLTQIDILSIAPEIGYEIGNKLIDLQDAIKLVNFNGSNTYSATGSTNQIKKTGGRIWGSGGRNFNNSTASPMIVNQDAYDPVSGLTPNNFPAMFDVYRSATGGTIGIPNLTGEIGTTTYDDGSGTPATIPDGYWVTYRIYLDATDGVTLIVKGQATHKGKIEALTSINIEGFTPPSNAVQWILRGAITFRKSASGFVDNKDVIVTVADKYGTIIVNSQESADRNLGVPTFKSYGLTSRGIGSGSYYLAGYYQAPATDANLTQASTTVSYGSSNASYASHPFAVAGGAGSVDAGQVGLRANFTSITDGGVRTALDSEILTEDITTLSLDQYIEVQKKTLGPVEFELYVVSGTPTTYSLDFNYGICKYEDWGNRLMMVTDFEVVGYGDANDTDFNIELLRHTDTGWTYSAAAFIPGNGAICEMSTDHSTDDQVLNNQYFAYKRADLNEPIRGDESEGVVIRITQSASGTIQSLSAHIGGEL